jgi:hypothetical protein
MNAINYSDEMSIKLSAMREETMDKISSAFSQKVKGYVVKGVRKADNLSGGRIKSMSNSDAVRRLEKALGKPGI